MNYVDPPALGGIFTRDLKEIYAVSVQKPRGATNRITQPEGV